MDIIQLLPDHVANQIAAGEVIQRPASAIKEMLENALDAGSSDIQVYIKDAGRTLLQVVDNGCGMSKKDVEMCFKKHATSKIKNANDLFNIQTMGFRGEALASIAAIAHVEVKSKLTNTELGSHLIIQGNKIQNHEDCATANGSSIKVKNLFYNVPARRKFLKSDKVEMRHITEEFMRIALANPKIKMQLSHNNTKIFHLTESNFRKRIVNILGEKRNETLVPISEKTSLVKISGFIGKPDIAKKTRGEQYFFVNKRFIKSHYLNHAVVKAFEEVIPQNYFPSYFINLEIDTELIDINIHPTKTEIKFEDEKAIYAIIRSTIKRSLGEYNIAPSLDFAQEISFNIDAKEKGNTKIIEPTIKINPDYNPFTEKIKHNTISNTNIKYEKTPPTLIDDIKINDSKNLIQIGNNFIASPNQEGLILIQQRRAHKRILFEYFQKLITQQNSKSQKLLFPKEINLNKIDLEFIKEMKEELKKIGFIISKKEDKLIITAVPPECQESKLQSIIEDLIEQKKKSEQLKNNQQDYVAKSLAESIAISNSKKLTNEEMRTLQEALLKCKLPSICPSGKRTMINIKINDLEKYF